MSGSGLVLVVIGAIIFLIGLVRHFAHMTFLNIGGHGSVLLFAIGIIVALIGIVIGQQGRRAVV
jgi:hypothetical protein